MQSRVIPIVSRRSFDFSELTGGESETIVAVPEVDVACYGDAVLLIRVHANATTGSSTIVVRAYSVSYTEEDPSVTFLAVSPAATVTIADGTSVPAGTLLLAGAEEAFGGSLQIQVVGTRVGTDTVEAEISIDLVARMGVPGPRRSLADTLVVGNATDGTDLVISSGDVLLGKDDSVSPGELHMRGGMATGGNTSGASVNASGGSGSGTGSGGNLLLNGGPGGATGPGGAATLAGGAGGTASGHAGAVTVQGGTPRDGDGAAATLAGSAGDGTNRSGGAAAVTGGNATGSGTGGAVTLTPGTSPSGTPGPITLVHTSEGVRLGSASGPKVLSGTGSPEGAIAGPVGSVYHRTDGGTGTTLYVKESGTGNTGWVAIAEGLSISGSDNQIVRLDGTSAVQNTPNTAIDDSGNPTFSGASALGTFGDGTASPGLLLRKAASGTSSIELRQTTSQTANDKRIVHSSDESLEVQHWTGTVWEARLVATATAVEVQNAQFVEEVVAHTVTGGATSLTLDFNDGNVHRVNLNAAGATVTLTLSNPEPGGRYRIVFELTDDNETHGLTWPGTVSWEAPWFQPGNEPPTLDTTADASIAYLLVDLTHDSTSGLYFGRWGAFGN